MDRILLDQLVECDEETVIEGPPLEALRFQTERIGGLVTVTDARGRDFRARVLRLSDHQASLRVFAPFSHPTESHVEIILLQALPEKERMELIIQKATELGVAAIFPFKSERSISLEEREAKQKKAHRWPDIVAKAVRQSRRARVPRVVYCGTFRRALDICQEEGLRILLWEKGGRDLKETIRGSTQKKVFAVVGPEGGLTEEEVALAMGAGFMPVNLGQRILRTETAAILLMGILQYELGDLAGGAPRA